MQEKMTSKKDIIEKQVFWNHIMEEHALFIRGYLDPSEEKLIKTANGFAEIFKKLLEETKKVDKKDIEKITEKNLKATKDIMEFKTFLQVVVLVRIDELQIFTMVENDCAVLVVRFSVAKNRVTRQLNPELGATTTGIGDKLRMAVN